MATRFLRYDSDPILRKKCKAVLKVDDKIRQLLDDMLDTLHETENGAALAANQVGVLKRLVVIDFNDTRLKLVNPQKISQSGVQECVEGCLSFPNRLVKTIRPQKVTIQALNEYGEDGWELVEMTKDSYTKSLGSWSSVTGYTFIYHFKRLKQ